MDKALLLNSTYEPLRIISWKRAFTLLFLEKIEVLHEYERRVRSVHQSFAIPAVVRLYEYVHIKYNKTIKFSKNNVFYRDGFRCAYCGKVFHRSQLTLDHVLPVSKGGPKTWENVVTACRQCNIKKGNKIIEKAGINLLYKPTQPYSSMNLYWFPQMKAIPDSWHVYLKHILPSDSSFPTAS